MEKICGIYKITNPKGKVYVGQSIDIERRKFLYSKLYCKTQTHLYNSLNKHGWDNHIFEIIELCNESLLLEKEIYWKQYYLNLVNNNFNQVLFTQLNDGKGGTRSEDIKNKIGKANSKPKPEGFGDKMSKIHQGKKRSEQTKQNMSKAHKGHSRYNDEWRKSISESLKNKPKPYQNKIVNQFSINGNFIKQYESITQASQISGVGYCVISHCCRGKGKTTGGYVWRFKE
jgi:group I intron endonuclease